MGVRVEIDYKYVGMRGSEAQRKSDEETLKNACKVFKKSCERDGIFRKFRQHEFYEKPSEKRRRALSRKKTNARRAQKRKENKS